MKNYVLLFLLLTTTIGSAVAQKSDEKVKGYPDFYYELIGIDAEDFPRLHTANGTLSSEVYLEQVSNWLSNNTVRFYQYLENRTTYTRFTSEQQSEIHDERARTLKANLRLIDKSMLLQRKLNNNFPFVQAVAAEKQAIHKVATKIYLVLIHKDDLNRFFNPSNL